MIDNIRPNRNEIEFLNLAYNKFYDLYKEVKEDSFWEQNSFYRFSKIKDAFAIYTELLNYPPITWVLEEMKTSRPPMESVIAKDLFKFIRNAFAHFPFYDSWDEVWIDKYIVNWNKPGQRIDKLLKKYSGKPEIKYRMWDPIKREMTYLSINFPPNYENGEKTFIKDILTEKNGIIFSFTMMKQVIDTQIIKE